eukprot:TRINITY_DN3467_c0_g1_i6.p1 TRINITY_DN3467_c0_g1~~TRINITY_DN3467_c0_g1_i6.p1  ORF type:complete len:953 (-),score=143.44 TRINITY_DN3467_c0_g1_i6:317-2812(-)
MASLLRVILWWWPPARYHIWNNAKFIARLESICVNPDPSITTSVLQLYSALALCGIGAMKLLENGETFLPIMVHCMQSQQQRHVRIAAFKLSLYLVRSAEACCITIGSFCEPIVGAIIDAMNGWRSLSSEKVPADQVPLVVEACRLALITRWEGEHHSYFWKLGIDRVLLDLLLNNFSNKLNQPLIQCQFKELIAAARKGLYVDGLLIVRPYIWDILGWLVTHCGESFSFNLHENGRYLNVLIACACSLAVDSIHKGRHLSHEGFPNASEHEPVSRAVLLMIFSPCKNIASQARHFLSEALIQDGKDQLEVILNYLKSVAKDDFRMSDSLRIIISLMGLEFYLSVLQYQNFIIRSEVLETLSCLTKRCLSGDIQVRRSSITQHLHDTSNARTCCWVNMDEWEGGDMVLFYSLQVLAELMKYWHFTCNHLETIVSSHTHLMELENSQLQILVDRLQEICNNNSFSPGLRWYAAYGLNFLGFYGFPGELGKRIGKARDETELADLQLVLPVGLSLTVHSVILMVRCPSLLPPKEKSFLDRSGELQDEEQPRRKIRQEVHLSSHVDNHALIKLLGYVYTGFFWADNGLIKQLKMLSRGCNLQSLLKMLNRKRPKWGAFIPNCDFTPALGPGGYPSSDIVLKAKATEGMHWSCSVCLLSTPHVHAHKIILWSSCDYLQALFQSGMQDSHSQSIEVPVCWEALTKLIRWFYSGELPKPHYDCLWNNMNIEEQLQLVQAYVELSWLSEFWFLEDVRKDSINVILSCLKSNHNLSSKILQLSAVLTQHEIVEAAVNYITPLYPQMRDSGDLEVLDEKLRDVIRAAYVHFSQECHYGSD